MKRTVIFLALTLGAGVVLAATNAERYQGERGDWHAKAEARFNQADRNHDGKLSFDEMQAAANQRLRERFDRLDSNHDGGVSLDEMRQGRQHGGDMHGQGREHWKAMHEKLQALDTNHDQALTKQEIGSAFPRLSENFDRLDTNHDGKLTREEMHAMHRMHRDDDQDAPPPSPR